MEFEIAKKLEKIPANVKGNSLRSIKADGDAAQMIIVADAYGDIKNAVENFRMATNADIAFRMRGKSIDISVMGKDALLKLAEFAKAISFNSEDAMDVLEFINKNMPLSSCEFCEMDMDQNRMKIVFSTNELTDQLQEQIMAKLDEFNMGIVK